MSRSMDPATESRPQTSPYTTVGFASVLGIGAALAGAAAIYAASQQFSDDPIPAVAQTDALSQVRPVSPEESGSVMQRLETNDVADDTQTSEHLSAEPSNQEPQPLDKSSPRFESGGENGRIGAAQAIEEKSRNLDSGRTAAIEPPVSLIHVEIAETEEEVVSLEAQMARDAPESFTTIAREESPVAEIPEFAEAPAAALLETAEAPAERPDEPRGERTVARAAPPVPEVAEPELPAEAPEVAEVPSGRDAPEASGEPVTEPRSAGLREAWATTFVNLHAEPDNDAEVIAVVPENAQIMAENTCLHWCEVDYNGQQGFIYKSFIRR